MYILYLINHKDVLFYTGAIILIKCSDEFVQGKIILKNKGLVINHGEERAPKQ